MGKAGQSARWEEAYPDAQNSKYWESLDHYKQQAKEYKNYADQWNKWMYVTGDKHPWMGVGYLDLTDQLAEFFHVKHGVLISEVVEDSPAAEAGLKAGDVLAVWEGEPLNSTAQFIDLLRQGEEGDEVELVIVRKGEKRKAEVTLGERKAEGIDRYRNFFFDSKKTPGPGYQSYSYQWPGRVVVPPSTPGPAAPPRMAAPEIPPIPEMPAITDSVQELQKTLGEQQKQLKKLMKEIQALKKQQQQR
jgi:membrane-associated protease RseP (regulator of RpoE activity)